MIFWEILRLAVSSLAANKLRSALTMLGIGVGVFSVIGVMTAINGLRGKIESGLNVLGANSFQVTKFPALSFHGPGPRFSNRKDITYEQSKRFKDAMGAAAEVSLQIGRGGRRVFRQEKQTNPNVILFAGDEGIVAGRNYEVATGRNIGPDDVEFGRAVAIMGQDVIRRLFPEEDPLGKSVRIDGQNYTIVGTLAPKGSSFGQSQDNVVVIPITQFLETYGRARRSMTINVKAPSAAALGETQEIAIGAMRLVRGLDPEDPNDFEIFSNESLIEAFNQITGVIAVGAFVISAIALVAAGVGVMNIMLVSVTERTREIGVRKSIGARKRSILVQFLIEAVTISMFGGLAGILFGVILGNVVSVFVLSGSVVFPWDWAAIGVLVCGGIGIGFGLYPAWRAANLDPIEALRYE
jgi:putative ABC transport system permease protein